MAGMVYQVVVATVLLYGSKSWASRTHSLPTWRGSTWTVPEG